MSDRQEQFSGTSAVRPGQEIDAGRLAEWMQANVEGYAGPLSIEQFKGGQSNPTYKLITASKVYEYSGPPRTATYEEFLTSALGNKVAKPPST
jgi:hypothetical protein